MLLLFLLCLKSPQLHTKQAMDTASIQTIDCEDEESGNDNPAFVIEESKYIEESVDKTKESNYTKESADKIKNVKVNGYQEHDVEEVEEEKERQQWSNPIEFLLSCISMSVSFCL